MTYHYPLFLVESLLQPIGSTTRCAMIRHQCGISKLVPLTILRRLFATSFPGFYLLSGSEVGLRGKTVSGVGKR